MVASSGSEPEDPGSSPGPAAAKNSLAGSLISWRAENNYFLRRKLIFSGNCQKLPARAVFGWSREELFCFSVRIDFYPKRPARP